MKADNLEQLKQLIEENPDEFPSTFLPDGSFAYHCYSSNAYVDLCTKLNMGLVDQDECSQFDITEDQWKEGMEMAKLVHYQEMTQISMGGPI